MEKQVNDDQASESKSQVQKHDGAFNIASISTTDVAVFIKDASTVISSSATETWSPMFSQSSDYEHMVIEQLDTLIQDMLNHENSLTSQKKAMLDKLDVVSRILKRRDAPVGDNLV